MFYREHLNPYVNLHRLSHFAKEVVDAQGKISKAYAKELIQTPLNKLASLAGVDAFLRKGITITQLQAKAREKTDLEAATAMNVARLKLFDLFNRRPKTTA